MKIKKFSINPDMLKMVALITMTIDHFYEIVLPDSAMFFWGTHIIGRFAMPLFSGLMMYHLASEKIFKKYLLRLISFGLLSVILLYPFQYCGYTAAYPLNIMCFFAFSISVIWILDIIYKSKTIKPFMQYFYSLLCIMIFAPFSIFMEYNISGFGLLLCFYFYFLKPDLYRLILVLFFSLYLNDFGVEGLCSALATLVIVNTDMKKSYPRLIKHWYTFYIYYPLHKVLFFIIAYRMMR